MSSPDKRFLIYPAAFMVNGGITMLNFSVIFFMRRTYGTSPALVGWMSAFWAFAYLIGCIGLGGISRRLSYRRALPLATSVMGISTLLILIIPWEISALFWYMLFGLITALHWPPLMGWLSEGLEGRDLSRAVGGFNLSWSTGAGAGPFIAGLLIERSLRLPLLVIALLYGFTAVLYITTFSLSRRRKSRIADLPEIDLPKIKDQSSPLRYAGWIGVASSYTLLGALMFIFPMYAEDVLGYAESFTGLLLFLRGAVTVAGFYLAGKTIFWHHNPLQISISQLLLGACALLLAFAFRPGTYLMLYIFFGLIFALQYATSIFHGVSGALNREQRMAIHEGSLTFGVVLGSAGGGLLYQWFSFRSVMVMIALAVAAASFAQVLSYRKLSRSTKKAAS
ncbi:MFS transporter [Marispirochaeta aestuarii]|uniref:MFS transporter n=1 Tax=Marispirochaeta aestuarii TaxID=1963862 RepID=UPI0029C6CDF3|nr:MFS transporter [Marispirochaeta aestuarii]